MHAEPERHGPGASQGARGPPGRGAGCPRCPAPSLASPLEAASLPSCFVANTPKLSSLNQQPPCSRWCLGDCGVLLASSPASMGGPAESACCCGCIRRGQADAHTPRPQARCADLEAEADFTGRIWELWEQRRDHEPSCGRRLSGAGARAYVSHCGEGAGSAWTHFHRVLGLVLEMGHLHQMPGLRQSRADSRWCSGPHLHLSV